MAAKSTKGKQLVKRKARVMVLSHSSEFLGGGERSMVDLFEYWSNKDYVDPYFIIREPLKGLEKEIRKRGWKYSAIHYTNWSQRNPRLRSEDIFRNARENAKAVAEIEKLIDTIKPDIVATNTLVAPWAALAAHFKQIPHVWFIREYGDIDHGHAFELGREATFKDIDALSVLVISNSKTLEDYLKEYINEDKLTTLYTPFDLTLLDRKINQDSKSPFTYQNSLKLVITGTISKSKGQDQVVRAVGELNKKGFTTELCVIGRPADENGADQLKKAVEEYDVQDKVHMLGQQTNPLSIVKHADIGIMSSQQEAFGRVTFEYMYTGKAVVGANSGATPELIKDGVNGRLYKSGSVPDLVKQLLVYAHNPDIVVEHGLESRKRAGEMMNGESNADSAYDKVERAVKGYEKQHDGVLNFSRRWLDYPLLAQQYIEESRVMSLKRLLYIRARGYAKTAYLRVSRILRRGDV